MEKISIKFSYCKHLTSFFTHNLSQDPRTKICKNYTHTHTNTLVHRLNFALIFYQDHICNLIQEGKKYSTFVIICTSPYIKLIMHAMIGNEDEGEDEESAVSFK